MIDTQNGISGNPFEDALEHEPIPRLLPSKDSFIKIPIVIACTILVFVLIVAGTATTAISFPPEPSPNSDEDTHRGRTGRELGPDHERMGQRTALDGDYKLLGPLLIMAGGFLLIVDVVLCVFITKEAYYSSRGGVQKNNDERPMSIVGGPYFLAVPSTASTQMVTPFALARQLWALPNAPLPDFAIDGGPLKGSRIRPSTAVLNQPPFNPDVTTPSTPVD